MGRKALERVSDGQGRAATRRRAAGRAVVERRLALSRWLGRDDRLLVEAVLQEGRSVAEIAKMTRTSRSTLSSRWRRLMRRLDDPLFLFMAHRLDALPATERAVARALFLEGRPLRATARELGLTYHRARQARTALLGLASAHGFNNC